jgi:hypothetical protein
MTRYGVSSWTPNRAPVSDVDAASNQFRFGEKGVVGCGVLHPDMKDFDGSRPLQIIQPSQIHLSKCSLLPHSQEERIAKPLSHGQQP